jgi:hypothetical protein
MIIIIIRYMQGIHTYIPEISHVSRELQCCSYPVVIVHGLNNAISNVKSIVPLHK